jgi:uncharacterized coiled-coil protein SlyX
LARLNLLQEKELLYEDTLHMIENQIKAKEEEISKVNSKLKQFTSKNKSSPLRKQSLKFENLNPDP